MFFIFKKKPLILDCLTYRPEVLDYAPIDIGEKHYPSWWSALSRSTSKLDSEGLAMTKTMKGCPGFIDFYKNSITIPMWCDFYFYNNGPAYRWQFSDMQSDAIIHSQEQYGEFLTSGQLHLKISTPWLIKCKEDINWVFVGNIWNQNYPGEINLLPGVVNYKYQHSTNINLVFNNKRESNHLIKVGTPLVNIFPMSERTIKINYQVVSEKDFILDRESSSKISFANGYQKKKKLMEKLEQSKCPFRIFYEK